MRHFFALLTLLCLPFFNYAQEKGQLSGDFQLNANFYEYDAKIGTQTPQYLHQLSSAESWLFLNYRANGFTLQTRFDLFNNSALLNPQEAYSKQGIGFLSVTKDFAKLSITAGSFYDQFGSGIIFRSYEDRNIGLDYAIQGVRVKYAPNDSFMIKAFTGVQKYRFDYHPAIIKGANTEKVWGIGKMSFVTGAAVINRTLDQNTINLLANQINSMPLEERFNPNYNVFAGSVYNTLRIGEWSMYAEYAKKTKEAVFIEQPNGSLKLQNKDGDVFYGGINYSHSGIGINLQYKKVNSFILNTSPYNTLLVGIINFLPPLSRQQAYRLPARYSISGRSQGEEGYQAEVTYSYNENNTFTLNASLIKHPTGRQLYREYYIDYNKKFNKKVKTITGIQSLVYDQNTYEGKPGVPTVNTITPFTEWTFKLTRRKSLRTELQYLYTKEDLGDFAYGLLEFNWAPHYSFSVSDMVNVKPTQSTEIIHYYTVFGAYTYNQTRVTLGYVKQVQGVVCTGGVCRVEPAFSGVRFGLTTNF